MNTPRRRLMIVIGAILLLGAVGVGLVQAAPGRATAATGTASVAGDGTTDAATIDTAIAALALEGLGIDEALDEDSPRRELHRRLHEGVLPRLRALVHSETTVDLPERGIITFSADHGTVAAISDEDLTIAEADGSSVTVALDDVTRVRVGRGPLGSVDGIQQGDEVFVLAIEEDGAFVARRILVLPDGYGADAETTPES